MLDEIDTACQHLAEYDFSDQPKFVAEGLPRCSHPYSNFAQTLAII